MSTESERTKILEMIAEGTISAEDGIKLNAYPNPFNNYLTIEFETGAGSECSLVLADVKGNILKEHSENIQPGYNSVRMKTEELPAGIYVLRLNAGSFNAIRKVIKTR